MKIGVVSDTHDRAEPTRQALALLHERGAELILHCGDITSAETVLLFAGWNVHFVWGNNDIEYAHALAGLRPKAERWSERPRLRAAVREIGGTVHEPFGDLTLAGRRVAWIHSDDAELFHELERSDRYDVLLYGHTHAAEQHRTGKTLVANPGALHRARPKTCALLDLAADRFEWITVG